MKNNWKNKNYVLQKRALEKIVISLQPLGWLQICFDQSPFRVRDHSTTDFLNRCLSSWQYIHRCSCYGPPLMQMEGMIL